MHQPGIKIVVVLFNLINCDLMICVFGNSFHRSCVETRHCLVSTPDKKKNMVV